MEYKKVDVIIPTYNPGERIKLLIARLLKQSYPICHIHVIDTEAGNFPEEIQKMGDNIRVTHIKPEEFDHGGTRHMGANMSDAEILVYMTHDAMPANVRMLEELIAPFDDQSVGASYGRQMPDKDCKIIERYTRAFNYPAESKVKSKEDMKSLGIKTFFCSNVCAAYRKSVYESLGGFEEKTIFNEDMIMTGRIIQSGYKIAYAAKAEVIHSHNYNCVQQFKRNFDLAVSQTDHPDIFGGVKSEGEGIRLVKKTAGYLLKIRRPWLIGSLFLKSGFKYAGYKLGQNYKRLPRWLVNKCTMNPRYWIEFYD